MVAPPGRSLAEKLVLLLALATAQLAVAQQNKSPERPQEKARPAESPAPSSAEEIVRADTLLVFEGHHEYGVESITLSPDGKLLASASMGRVVVLKASNGEVITKIDRLKAHVAFGPKGKLLAATNRSSLGVGVWDVASGKMKHAFKASVHPYKKANGVAISPDGKRLAFGAFDRLRVWSLENGEEQLAIDGHEINSRLMAVAFSPDGTKIASATAGGYYSDGGPTRWAPNEVKVWDAKSGKELASLRGGGYGLAFSPDGTMIASASRKDSAVTVWQVATGKELHKLPGRKLGRSVTFSPDGKWLAAGRENAVNVWNLRSGKATSLTGHDDEVMSVIFSPDGKRLFSGSADKTIRVWKFTPR